MNDSGLSTISLINIDENKLRNDDKAKTISFFCKKRPVRIDRNVISDLRKISENNNRANVRICLHDSPMANHHDMVILERKGKYYRPHKHNNKGEAFHIISGQMGIFSFDDDGCVIDSVILFESDIYRVESGQYHAVLPITDDVIYHENKPGPFLGDEDSIFPDWAPDGTNANEIDEYLVSLRSYINK